MKDSDFEHHCALIAGHFLRRGYPLELVIENLVKAQDTPRDIALSENKEAMTDEENQIFYLTTTFNPKNDQLRKIVTDNWEVLQRSSVTKDLSEYCIVL